MIPSLKLWAVSYASVHTLPEVAGHLYWRAHRWLTFSSPLITSSGLSPELLPSPSIPSCCCCIDSSCPGAGLNISPFWVLWGSCWPTAPGSLGHPEWQLSPQVNLLVPPVQYHLQMGEKCTLLPSPGGETERNKGLKGLKTILCEVILP